MITYMDRFVEWLAASFESGVDTLKWLLVTQEDHDG